jgi:calcium-binding protein CML
VLLLIFYLEQLLFNANALDSDNSGSIDVEELKQVLVALGEEATDQQAKDLMHDIDKDGNGVISFEEFREAMAVWWLAGK